MSRTLTALSLFAFIISMALTNIARADDNMIDNPAYHAGPSSTRELR